MRIILILLFSFSNLSLKAMDSSVDIKKEIESYLLKNNISNKASLNLDFVFPECKSKINITDRYGDHKTLKISCLDSSNWSYNIKNKIKSKKNKLVKKSIKKSSKSVVKIITDLKRGQTITEEDIKVFKTRLTLSSDSFRDTKSLLGRKLKRSLKSGYILRERHLVKNWAVVQGQPVVIESIGNNIMVLADGTVKKSAMKGDITDVINDSSGKVVRAWVVNDRKVLIKR